MNKSELGKKHSFFHSKAFAKDHKGADALLCYGNIERLGAFVLEWYRAW